MSVKRFIGCIVVACVLAGSLCAADAIKPLQAKGEDFVDAAGKPVKFWGVNLVALYPTHQAADNLAANLASLQVNLARPHHMLRPSSDWVSSAAPSVSLQKYGQTTREPDPEAWDRFDYLNAALRKNGIYLMLANWWTRQYRPGDVDVLTTDDADRTAWMAGIEELNSWNWRKSFDVRKMLCLVDDRVAALEEEFAKQLLTHVNPYTKLAYGRDPQVLTLEFVNENSVEYNIICTNRFPEYFHKKFVAKWEAFARSQGIEPGDPYKPADRNVVKVRSAFFRKLEEDFFKRMQTVVRSTGCKAALTYSNLWRGENVAAMHARDSGYIEDHMYGDPMVVSKANDLVYALTKTPVAGKPFIVGELNQSEGDKNILQQSPSRAMLLLASSAYGSLQNWSGMVYFAWLHGDRSLGADGWATSEERKPSIGNLITDGMQIDHMRTCGIMFRRGMVNKSTSPISLHVEEAVAVGDYNGLMRGKYVLKPGWQDIHEVRKVFGPVPAAQADAPWLTQDPPNPLVSDTQQIVKDIERKQLTVTAPMAEAFGGNIDNARPAGLKHLQVTGEGFATVVVVADDNRELGKSSRLIISRTGVATSGAEIDGPAISLAGLQAKQWQMRITRPREAAKGASLVPLTVNGDRVTLPGGTWHECELEIRP